MYLSLTAECRRSPLQDNSSLTALRSVSLQHVTQTLVCTGAAGTQIIHTRSIEHLGWHQLMTALKHGRLQHCAASVRSLTGRVSCFITRVNAYRVRTLNTWISTAHLQGDQSIYSLTFMWNTLTNYNKKWSILLHSPPKTVSFLLLLSATIPHINKHVLVFNLPVVSKHCFWVGDLSVT